MAQAGFSRTGDALDALPKVCQPAASLHYQTLFSYEGDCLTEVNLACAI